MSVSLQTLECHYEVQNRLCKSLSSDGTVLLYNTQKAQSAVTLPSDDFTFHKLHLFSMSCIPDSCLEASNFNLPFIPQAQGSHLSQCISQAVY